MNQDRTYEEYAELVSRTYPSFLRRLGIEHIAENALGCTITDSSGRTYIDCVAGYGINNLGNNNPEIIRELVQQLTSKGQLNRPLLTRIQAACARQLADIAPDGLDCSILCNSGSEAIDNAMKLARLVTGRQEIVTAQGSFHGFTYGAMSAAGTEFLIRNFGPLLPGIVHVRFGDLKAIEELVTSKTAAILLEPIQHEAGIHVPDKEYLNEVAELCHRAGALLILDEVKTGFGKTGKMFASEWFNVVPDVLVLGKSMGGGAIPAGGIIARKELWGKVGLSHMMSATSYGGNVLACRAIMATIDILSKKGFLEECRKRSDVLMNGLKSLIREFPTMIRSIDGLGFLLGIHCASSKIAMQISRNAISMGILILPALADPSTIMIEPPIVISESEIGVVIAGLRRSLDIAARGGHG